MKNKVIIFCLLCLSGATLIAGPIAAQESEHTLDMIMDIGCSTCHSPGTQMQGELSISSTTCLGCHETGDRQAWAGQVFHGSTYRECTECHLFHDTEMLRGGGVTFRHQAGVAQVQLHCRTCHDVDRQPANLSAEHRSAVSVYHGDSAELAGMTLSEACQECHGQSGGGAQYINEHASHPVGVPVPLGRGNRGARFATYLPDNVEVFSGHMECQTCHLLTGGQVDLLQVFDSPKLLCDSCHKMGERRQDPFMVADTRPEQPMDRRR